ncbi:MAG: Rpn family recombination-promoting nuclease/putative transposase [Defluviitaleaceae bacterium]|nr:Rpn family recombination-promoting nuclease/putative transposase [Defluviitaleaceae bacterium]
MNAEPPETKEQYEDMPDVPTQTESIEEAFIRIIGRPRRKYTQQEIDEARENLALMNDRLFAATFMENKNNHIVTGIVNSVRKIHDLAPIPPIEQTKVQDLSLFDVLGRGMIGDLTGWGKMISIAIEAQNSKQDGYAVRGTLTTGNAMRVNFNIGDDYTEAPDVVTINFLNFRLPELKNRKMFCSRIISAEYESRELFLADKYSTYYVELPKMNDFKKSDLPIGYHDLWDLCCIFKTKIKEHEEEIKMQAITNPVAIELAGEIRKAAAPNELVNDTLNNRWNLEDFRKLVEWHERKAVEGMIITALQNSVPIRAIEAMCKNAGITEARLAELKSQVQMA